MKKTDYALTIMSALCDFVVALSVYGIWKNFGEGYALGTIAWILMANRKR